jgi:TonB family protein
MRHLNLQAASSFKNGTSGPQPAPHHSPFFPIQLDTPCQTVLPLSDSKQRTVALPARHKNRRAAETLHLVYFRFLQALQRRKSRPAWNALAHRANPNRIPERILHWMPQPRKFVIGATALLLCLAIAARPQDSPAPATRAQSPAAADTAANAVCEIVYQMDNGIPGPRGYHYVFYGNGFFINKDGDLLTAAHVLSQLHGGQPYLLLRDATGIPQFIRADLLAVDRDHDVAVLQATPNPFDAKYQVSFLPLAPGDPMQGEMVEATSRSPSTPRDAYSLDRLLEQHSAGEVLRFEFSKLDKNAPETQLFLFNHKIQPGQSGSPVVSESLQAATGLVEGQWLKQDASLPELANETHAAKGAAAVTQDPVAPIPGAAVSIHYAIALLQRKGIVWTPAASADASTNPSDESTNTTTDAANQDSALPRPLSLVPAQYPPESLFGNEVVLSALVGRTGALSDIQEEAGDEPFLRDALDAAHTWTFHPAEVNGQAAGQRIAIIFQFPQPYVPPRRPTIRHYDDAATDNTRALVDTVEAAYPPDGDAEGSAILYATIDAGGHVASIQTVSGDESIAESATDAAKQWQFSPARSEGQAAESAAVIVVTFRHPLSTSAAPQGGCVAKMCGDHQMCTACDGAGGGQPQKEN